MAEHTTGTLTTSDDVNIHHQSWVPAGHPRAVVVIVHGLGEHSGRYTHVADALVTAGYAVNALDHRGHGRSGGRRTFVKGYEEFMGDLDLFRAHVSEQHPGVPIVLLGHSMGGNLVVGYALDHQEGLAGLVLSAPALKVGDEFSSVQLKVFEVMARLVPTVRPQGLDSTAISRDPAVVQAYLDDPYVFNGKITAGLGWALIDAMARFPDRYRELTVPILTLHGSADRLADIEGTRELEIAAVNAPLTAHYYEGLYHEVFNEPEQERVIGDLVAWLEALTTAASD